MKIIRVSAPAFTAAIDALEGGKKIQAIKLVRTDAGTGLRETKEAVERLSFEKGFNTSYGASVRDDVARIVVGPIIKKVVLDYGHGPLEVDLEEMQLRALMDMQAIGLDACRDILDLVEALNAFSDGKRIVIVEDEDDQAQ